MSAPVVWVILLNWNGLADTLACLASLRAAAAGPYRVQVLVVDSASVEDPRPAIAAAFPEVLVECLERNLGFTGGSNHGIRAALAASADYVLLLNNDTLVDADFLPPLLGHLERHPALGVVGPLICYADEPGRIWFAGATFGLATGRSPHWLQGRPIAEAPSAPFATGFVSGCCLAMRADDLRRHGLLAEGFFAYYEDVELCVRFGRAGLGAACVPASRIQHKVGASTRRAGRLAPLAYYFSVRNRALTVRRHGGPIERLCFTLLANPLRVLAYSVRLGIARRWKELAWLVLGLVHGLEGREGGPPG